MPNTHGKRKIDDRLRHNSLDMNLGDVRLEVNYAGFDMGVSSTYMNKKAPRAMQACNACRASKIKCDELHQCANCDAKRIECVRDPPQVRNSAVNTQTEIFNQLGQLLRNQEIFQNALAKSFPSFEEQLILEKQLHGGAGNEDRKVVGTTISLQNPESDFGAHETKSETARAFLPEWGSKPAIPPDHTTGWQRVLQWPAVTNIVGECMRSEGLSFDPMKQESERDLLYSTGQDEGLAIGGQYEGDDGNQAGIQSEGRFQTNSKPPRGRVDSHTILAEDDGHVLNQHISDEELGVDVPTVRRLVDCYLSKLAVMHPIVAPRQLNFLLDEFWALLPDIRTMLIFGYPISGDLLTDLEMYGSKSKMREPLSQTIMLARRHTSPWDAKHSINMAIVLLVLALGCVCQTTADNPLLFDGQAGQDLSQKTPGHPFFVAATSLMGLQICGNLPEHVQANLLAGLYYGQFSRILESHTHYFNASRALYMILKPRRRYLEATAARNGKLSPEDNLLVITYWTCLQLESDIVAELDVPQSPILAWESTMPWPDVETAVNMGLELRNMECYIALLWLRKRLNHIHAELYAPGVQEGYTISSLNHLQKFPFIDSLRESLAGFNALAPSWSWSPPDAPAREILAARLRGKYYGGQVIVLRPFLRMVLNNGMPGVSDNVPPESISPLIMQYAAHCAQELVRSTQAFQNVDGGRLIVTNPWGTAYAQCGNVIVLLAVYNNASLRRFVDSDVLKDLVHRTLRFVSSVAYSSPELWNMHRVLEFAAATVLGLVVDEME